jgi:integrase
LSALLNAAEAEDLLLQNPMHKIRAGKKAPKQPKPDPVAMTADESQRFLDAASSTAYGFMFDLAFFLNGMGGRFSPRTVNLRSPALIKQNTASFFMYSLFRYSGSRA